ncbi:unnamed protein product [Camellia sinensis]
MQTPPSGGERIIDDAHSNDNKARSPAYAQNSPSSKNFSPDGSSYARETQRRLIEAAQMEEETPLHIASMAGHLDFVQQILKLRPEFATELNQDGFSPLHIASANGYLEIVKELLRVDRDMCAVRGREKRIPLHYAVIKGRIHVMKELLAASPDSVEHVTVRGETALHLAVKKNQIEGLRVLVEHIKEFKKEGVLNMKDEHGNTILHLAISGKQYEVVDLLLGELSVTRAVMEVNSLNKNSLTALDVLLIFQSEAGDREIEDVLVQAGAKRARDLHTSALALTSQNQGVTTNPSNGPLMPIERTRSPARQLLEYFKYNKIRDSPSEARNAMLVIAVLIATATYQAVLSPPGGVWQDDSLSSNNNGTDTTKPHSAGKAVMGSKNTLWFGLFIFFNSVGFFTSINMIYVLTSGFPLQLELQVSMCALVITYDTSMAFMTANNVLSVLFTVVSIALPLMIHIATMVARNYLKLPRVALQCTSLQSA